MRKYCIPIAILLVVLTAGCATLQQQLAASPMKQWAAAQKTFNATVNILADCVRAGEIPLEDAEIIQQAARVAQGALDDMHRQAERGNIDAFRLARVTYDKALDELEIYLIRKEAEDGPNATAYVGAGAGRGNWYD